ncbi:SusC/RagA family TonB-linked outer membrane protein [Sediminibacterium ginsengisoli]|uniref:TonB-linked outer membrane protein, SusC/RagA family n=1 Tax=Sediminibacterium ginsengisoli TaxID=413434 RepID=A0A1T4MNA0_9BACT|nr:SusC/RagA family TonB-linked outer membrane protein [Sediminibacterium ginsengisoli]SJZ68423.1 TonB-linked outer membrane protein, SusC/RagA family [Sediminibacterium ginsengisoli]
MSKTRNLLSFLCLLLIPLLGISQNRQISGKITNEKGEPIPFASVLIRSTTRGISANENGVFSLSVNGKPILVVSSTGYLSREIQVTDAVNYDVVLKPDLTPTSEVVVTALGITRKERSLGYAQQGIKGGDLTAAKEQNLVGSLSGKIAGVQVSGSSGASMGGTQKIQIRGVNSVTGDGEPLIVIDNTPVSNSNYAGRNGRDYGNLAQDINPDDVESINVLKGPAASALYGLRGQYGVILITTKKGSRTKAPTVTLSSAFSIEKAGNFMPLQNLYGSGSSLNFPTVTINGVSTKYVDGSWDESWGPLMDGTPVRQQYSFYPADRDFGKATPFIPHPDNIKEYFETGHTFNNNIAFSGGGQNGTFRLSYNNTDIKGIEPNTFLKRNNLSFNGSLNVTSGLVLNTSLNYANNNAQRPSQGYQSLGSRNMNQWFQRNLDMQRLKEYKYPDGTFYQWNLNSPNAQGIYTNMTPIDWNNPYFDAYENPSHDSRDRFYGNVGLTYTILPGLQVTGTVRQDGFTQNIDGRNAAGGRGTPSFWIGKYESKERNYEFLAQLNKQFGKVSFNANLGGNLMYQDYSYLREETAGGLAAPGFYSISNSIDRPNAVNYSRKKQVRSAYGSVTVGYDNIYFIDASLRRDISSALPANNNGYLYPSVSASMVFSDVLKWNTLSYGKLRLGYAQAGADIDVYQTTQSYSLGTPYGTNFPLAVPDRLFNADLKPSLGTSFEAGLDLRFLKDRLGLSFTYYNQQNKDAVIPLDVPGPSGFTSYVINAGNIENKGFELSLNAVPVKSNSITWNTTFNIARNTSMVKALYPGINSLILDQNTYSSVSVFLQSNVGEAFGTLVGNAYARDAKTGKILLDAANMPMYVTNHNFGSVLPKFTGGWQNSVSYKNFDLTAMIDFQSGGQFFSWTKMLAVKSGQAAETATMNDKGKNIRDDLANGGGYKITGISSITGAEVTAYVNARTYFRNTIGTRVYEEWLYDASFIRMREIRLGYTFTKEQFAKLPVKSVNLAFITRNPFMIWQKAPKGLNPAELATGSSSLNWLETGQLATSRSYGINLNISF